MPEGGSVATPPASDEAGEGGGVVAGFLLVVVGVGVDVAVDGSVLFSGMGGDAELESPPFVESAPSLVVATEVALPGICVVCSGEALLSELFVVSSATRVVPLFALVVPTIGVMTALVLLLLAVAASVPVPEAAVEPSIFGVLSRVPSLVVASLPFVVGPASSLSLPAGVVTFAGDVLPAASVEMSPALVVSPTPSAAVAVVVGVDVPERVPEVVPVLLSVEVCVLVSVSVVVCDEVGDEVSV